MEIRAANVREDVQIDSAVDQTTVKQMEGGELIFKKIQTYHHMLCL